MAYRYPADADRQISLSVFSGGGFQGHLRFSCSLSFLKSSCRRGIRQLSLFELVVILTLDSAAGDVSFYHDVPLFPVAVVFLTLLLLYRLTVLEMTKSKRFEA